jgi:glutamate synthase domain-containing protein 1
MLIKNPAMRAQLGELMTPMLVQMGARGPESAGLAVFRGELPESERKYSLHAPAWDYDWAGFEAEFIKSFPPTTPPAARAPLLGREGKDLAPMAVIGNHAVLTCDESAERVKRWVKERFPKLHVLSAGRAMDIFKDTGHPADVATRYDFTRLAGTHVVGHTRMATESAVTPDRAHPFTAGEDFCLVHNGTISNPYMVRRKLEHLGIEFETDNDTEAATRFLEWRMREGDDLEGALTKGFEELDGFYTFLIGTRDKLALVRDAFACKPAVVAETDDYVAIASEFRSLAKLPDVKNAALFEPMPEELYVWKV